MNSTGESDSRARRSEVRRAYKDRAKQAGVFRVVNAERKHLALVDWDTTYNRDDRIRYP